MWFQNTPFQLAWDAVKEKVQQKVDGRAVLFGCPDCNMPIDEGLQQSNVRIEQHNGCNIYVLSCPWCHRVMNIGETATVDQTFIIAKKDA